MTREAHAHPHAHPHDHDHDHGQDRHGQDRHGQDHGHHHEAATTRAQPVVLDLGDGIGALVVHTAPGLLGTEVEISPAGEDANRQHKEVLKRMLGPEVAHVLVYDNLPEGKYTLWIDDVPRARDVRVEGGSVAEHLLD